MATVAIAVVTACRDSDKTAIGRGHIALAPAIVSPGRDRAIFFQAEAIPTTSRDGGKAGAGVNTNNLVAPAPRIEPV